jgi:hypothetical protein
MSHTVNIPSGQTLLLYRDSIILLRKKHDKDSVVTTPWSYFVGTDEEVEAKVAELNLASIVRPTFLKQGIKPSQVPNEKPSVGIFKRIINFIKNIF